MAALYLNENIPASVAEALRTLGHDVETALEAGLANRRVTDPDVLVHASENARAVVTHNWRHFKRLHEDGHPHRGIIICKASLGADELARRIDEELQAIGEVSGRLIKVYKHDPRNWQASRRKVARHTEGPDPLPWIATPICGGTGRGKSSGEAGERRSWS